jgi:predicted PurR-regulated permease PerM
VQVVLGNIVDPKLMGNKLNLSPLLVLISLGFWGAMWGVVGMLLSVPIMVSINIVLSEFKSTRAISVFFSEKGDIKSK